MRMKFLRLLLNSLTLMFAPSSTIMDSRQPDYLIIGGGTSGLVVANRLSENPNTHILVLEAGHDLSADPRVNIPALFSSLSE